MPKGKKTDRHNVQKGRANPCVIQVTVRGQMDGNGEGFEDQCSGMSSLGKSAP